MKIVRKKDINKIRVVHNRGLFWFIIVLILFFIVFLVYASQNFGVVEESVEENLKCESDADCVPELCCHAATCVHVSEQPNCNNMMCTMECVSGTMDCGGGRCGCVNGYCGVVVSG